VACVQTLIVKGGVDDVISSFEEAVHVHVVNFGNKHWGSIHKDNIAFPFNNQDFVDQESACAAIDTFLHKHRRVAIAARYGDTWIVQAVCKD
jgi:hypothetical protein